MEGRGLWRSHPEMVGYIPTSGWRHRATHRGIVCDAFGCEEWNAACDDLELDCTHVHEEVLESGFRHLEDVRSYSDWDKVVAANSRNSVRIRLYK